MQGHTAHATEDEARELVLKILGWYRMIYEDLMAVPVIPGWKSEKEKFDGADATSTIEVRDCRNPPHSHHMSRSYGATTPPRPCAALVATC